jgi:tRNA-uridine 2-sulfurtransferase
MSKTKVVVGLSGGVDSSVTAALLIEQGYDVIGIFMRNWNDGSVIINQECPWIDDSNDALLVAQKLNIPFQVLDLSVQYKERIVDYMHAEYEIGRTPNPDILCNREVKFDIFLDAALKLGAELVATGHYCQKSEFKDQYGKIIYQLKSGADKNKDQSYFLCQVNQYQLSKALFPIGHLQKSEVREIAKKYDLITADKKDSQGLCFIGKVKLSVFLQNQLKPKEGDIIEIESNHTCFDTIGYDSQSLTSNYHFNPSFGKKIGIHNGVQFYTIGQRKGLGIGGTEFPLFIIEKDAKYNIIYVGRGEEHRGLYRTGLKIIEKETHWIREDLEMKNGESRTYQVQIRYRQDHVPAKLIKENNDLFIIFEEPMKSIASGQFAAWYDGEELIGSGVIS